MRLVPATILDYCVQRPKAIAPANFFALFVGTAIVGNSNLENPTPQPGHFRYNFRLNAKPVLFYLNGFNNGSFEDLITCLDVGQIKVREHV